MQIFPENLLRKIIHVDMDCFYAAVEIRDKPYLQNKPVAIGGTSRQRGVLCTCNYEARKYGVRSAMPTWQAINKCPELVLLPVDMDKYKAVSKSIHKIFKQYTEVIEPLSLDEAFLDVSNSSIYNGSATLIAQAIREDILRQEAITASAGISFNKFLAKIASDLNKPNGQYVIRPEDKDKFIINLPVNKIYGVGKVTAKKLHELGISTCHDLQQLEIKALINIFGKYGRDLYYLSRGVDNRIVQTARSVKSVSVEETYDSDLSSFDICKSKLVNLYNKLLVRLSKCSNNKINTLFVKLKFRDFTQTTVETKFSVMDLKNFSTLIEQALQRKNLPVRLIGIGVKFIEHIQSTQLEFDLKC
jgi:DNA polymerase-4